MVALVRGRTHEPCSTGFCGSWAQGRSGANCPRNIRRTKPAIAASSSGCARSSWSARLLHGGKKGGLAVGPTKRGKGTKILALADDHSLPLAVSVENLPTH